MLQFRRDRQRFLGLLGEGNSPEVGLPTHQRENKGTAGAHYDHCKLEISSNGHKTNETLEPNMYDRLVVSAEENHNFQPVTPAALQHTDRWGPLTTNG